MLVGRRWWLHRLVSGTLGRAPSWCVAFGFVRLVVVVVVVLCVCGVVVAVVVVAVVVVVVLRVCVT